MSIPNELLWLRDYDEFKFCMLEQKSKIPCVKGWQNQELNFDEVMNKHLEDGNNVGLILGSKTGIMDIDCDCAEASAFTSYYLRNSIAHFSRSLNSAHYLVKCSDGGKTIQIRDDNSDIIVELRGDGAQTMIPPSTHPEGNKLFFDSVCETVSEIDYQQLVSLLHKVAISTLVARHWKVGRRHKLSLSLCGFLQSIGVDYSDAFDLIQAVCDFKKDEESLGRINNLKLTYARPAQLNLGYSGLSELFSSEILKKIFHWSKLAYDIEMPATPVGLNENFPVFNFEISKPNFVNDVGLAEAFSRQMENKARFCFDERIWYLWNEKNWEKDTQRQILQLEINFIKEAINWASVNGYPEIGAKLSSYLSSGKLENLEKVAQSNLPVRADEFDVHDMQLCVKNGILDLRTGALMAAEPNLLHRKNSNVLYDQNAQCPTFRKFLNDVFQEDIEILEYIQKVAGYMLTGSTKEQCLFMFLGGGANGKSTLVNVLSKLLGDYSVNAAANTLMASNNNSLGDDLIRLAGARLITVAETEYGQRFAEAKIKSITGGDKITGRPLYGNWIEFKPVGKIVLSTNARPEIRGADDGIWRRIREVPFECHFPEEKQDRELAKKLYEEISGILNWAVEGCLKWQKVGLSIPKKVLESTLDYRQEMDTIECFIEDKCQFEPNQISSVSNVYEQYREWCLANGKQPNTKVQFGKSLSKKGFDQRRTSAGRYWQGLICSR